VIRHVAVLDGEWAALAGYGSAVLRCTARDRLIGCSGADRIDRLRGCRGVRILATSRQALGVGGEQVFGLRPLSLPPPDAGLAVAAASEAVSLFVQRAATARRDFALSPANLACDLRK
jgi:hypothetical protein